MSREINSLIASIRNRAEENDGGRPKHNRMAFNCEHFVCLELLILLMMESCKHTISICMVLRSDGGDKRGKKPSSRLCWSRMMCSRQPCVSEACEEIKSQAEESSDRGAVSTRQQSRAVRKALNCGRSAPIFFPLVRHASACAFASGSAPVSSASFVAGFLFKHRRDHRLLLLTSLIASCSTTSPALPASSVLSSSCLL
jgi:hypothetical protein